MMTEEQETTIHDALDRLFRKDEEAAKANFVQKHCITGNGEAAMPDVAINKIPLKVRERRIRIFWLRQRHALDVLQGGIRSGNKVWLPEMSNLPQGARVETCFYSDERQAFGIIVLHESFDIVPDGAELPSDDFAAMEYKAVQIVTDQSPADVGTMNREELLKLRDEVNTRLFDLERQPAG